MLPGIYRKTFLINLYLKMKHSEAVECQRRPGELGIQAAVRKLIKA